MRAQNFITWSSFRCNFVHLSSWSLRQFYRWPEFKAVINITRAYAHVGDASNYPTKTVNTVSWTYELGQPLCIKLRYNLAMDKFNVDSMSLEMLEAIFITRYYASRVGYAGAGDYGALWRVPVGFGGYAAWVYDEWDMVDCVSLHGWRVVRTRGAGVVIEMVMPAALQEFDSELEDWLAPAVARWSKEIGDRLRVWGEMCRGIRVTEAESEWLSQVLDMADLRWVSVNTGEYDEIWIDEWSFDSGDELGDDGLREESGESCPVEQRATMVARFDKTN